MQRKQTFINIFKCYKIKQREQASVLPSLFFAAIPEETMIQLDASVARIRVLGLYSDTHP
jgi:hypothetical protein